MAPPAATQACRPQLKPAWPDLLSHFLREKKELARFCFSALILAGGAPAWVMCLSCLSCWGAQWAVTPWLMSLQPLLSSSDGWNCSWDSPPCCLLGLKMELKQLLPAICLPTGYHIEFGGTKATPWVVPACAGSAGKPRAIQMQQDTPSPGLEGGPASG